MYLAKTLSKVLAVSGKAPETHDLSTEQTSYLTNVFTDWEICPHAYKILSILKHFAVNLRTCHMKN